MEFRLLGDIDVRVDERPLTIGYARLRSVLAVLLVEANRVVPVDQLVDRVWGDGRLPYRPRAAVQHSMAMLRKALTAAQGVTIAWRPPGYQVTVDRDAVDLHRFRTLTDQARRCAEDDRSAKLFDQALLLWRGTPFAGLDTPWFNAVRASLSDEGHAARLDLIDIRLRLGQHGTLLTGLSEYVHEHPLDERLAGQYLLALYRSGRQAESLAHYHLLRRRLAEELGADPSVQLRHLHQQIITADPELILPAPCPATPPARIEVKPPIVAALPIPRELPTGTAHFTGRSREIAELDAQLERQRDDHRTAVMITAIDGMAGVGKTTLAVHWAWRVRHHFPDGHLYVNLRGFDPLGPPIDPADVLDGLLRTLNVPADRIPTELDARARLYRSLLAGRRMLLVLDNAATVEQVRQLLPGSPSCLVVVTSRSRLSGLAAREGVHRVTLDLLPAREALALLRAIIGRDRVDAEPTAAADLVCRCAYLPLALRIAAERVAGRPHLTLANLAGELADVGERLDLLCADGDDTMAVRTVFSWSYRVLPPDAARAFRLLGLHSGADIGVPAVAALVGRSPARARRLLDILAGVHLIEEVGPDRYRLHDLLRNYAADLVAAEETEQARTDAVRQLLGWYLHTAQAAGRMVAPPRSRVSLSPPDGRWTPLDFGTRDEAVGWYETELSNLIGAIHQAAEAGEHATAWQLPAAMWDFFALRKHWMEWITTHRVGLDAARRGRDVSGEAWMLNLLGPAYRDVGQHEVALDCFRKAMAAWREVGDRQGEGWTLYNLGDTYRELGRLTDALESFQRSLAISRELGVRWGEGWVLNMIGDTFRQLGRFDEAISCLTESLAIRQEVDDRIGNGWTLNMLGDACVGLGRFDEAVGHLRRSLAIGREAGVPPLEGHSLMSLGDALRELGQPTAARESWRAALAIFEPTNIARAEEIRIRLARIET